MKNKLLILVAIILVTAASCKKNSESNFGLDCDKLRQGIYNANFESNSNDSLLKVEIDKLTQDLTPELTIADEYGQLANLYTLFSRLENCNPISFNIKCYSCVQTAPPQTEVSVCIDSSGFQICRIFDFYTWEHSMLEFAGAHLKYR
jgi:hypothetical protein